MKRNTLMVAIMMSVSMGQSYASCPVPTGNYILKRHMIVPGGESVSAEIEESLGLIIFDGKGKVSLTSEYHVNTTNNKGLQANLNSSPSYTVTQNLSDCSIYIALDPNSKQQPSANIVLLPQSNGSTWLGISQDEEYDSKGAGTGHYRKLIESYVMTAQ